MTADGIRVNAAKLKEFRDLLNDKEPAVRLQALNDLTEQSDPAAQELAFDIAFSSADNAMRSLALRKRMMRLANIDLEIVEARSEGILKAQNEGRQNPVPTSFGWLVVAADTADGVLKLHDNNRQFSPDQLRTLPSTVSVSGTTISISTRNIDPTCDGMLRMDDTNQLSGTMTCLGSRVGSRDNVDKVLMKVRMRVH